MSSQTGPLSTESDPGARSRVRQVRALLAADPDTLVGWLQQGGARHGLSFLRANDLAGRASHLLYEAGRALEEAQGRYEEAERLAAQVLRWADERPHTLLATPSTEPLPARAQEAARVEPLPGMRELAGLLRAVGGVRIELTLVPTPMDTVEVGIRGEAGQGLEGVLALLSDLMARVGGGFVKPRGVADLLPRRNIDDLMRYYEEGKRRDPHYTLERLAEDFGYSHQYMKNRHAAWRKREAARQGR